LVFYRGKSYAVQAVIAIQTKAFIGDVRAFYFFEANPMAITIHWAALVKILTEFVIIWTHQRPIIP
jgi:hypothetical protein